MRHRLRRFEHGGECLRARGDAIIGMMTVGAGVDPFVLSPPFLFAIVVVGDPVFSLCRRSREWSTAWTPGRPIRSATKRSN